jgi:hypothetical protein
MEMLPRTRNRDNEVDGERNVDACDRRGVYVTCQPSCSGQFYVFTSRSKCTAHTIALLSDGCTER